MHDQFKKELTDLIKMHSLNTHCKVPSNDLADYMTEYALSHQKADKDGIEPKLGDKVKATMNHEDWFIGVYEKESDVLAQYGVRRDDTKELRYFIHAEIVN